MLLFHTLVIRSLFIAPVTGMTIVFLFTLWRKPVWVERMFMILGRHSTNIWLIHMFFYLCIFKNLVFKLSIIDTGIYVWDYHSCFDRDKFCVGEIEEVYQRRLVDNIDFLKAIW